ncbi:hypothetical protein [Nisaea sp.]|uniref:hypothetical protein n=1 Tax=Nisaea sp. TaxID=2024842 RepID=UPI0032ED0030
MKQVLRAGEALSGDFAYLRHQRNLSEKIGTGVRLMVLTSVISAGLATIWLGLRHALSLK